MALPRPPSGMISFSNTGDSEKRASSNNKQTMKEKMLRQRQLSLERQRNAAKSTFVGVKAQDLPIHQSNGYDRASNVPRIDFKGPNMAMPNIENKNTPSGANLAPPIETTEQPMVDTSQPPRCQTANSNFSSVELLSNDGDGRPGFEHCGGRATAEQQGVAKNVESWNLSVAREPTAEISGSKEEAGNGKKWWKPNLFGGNRVRSESPGPGMQRNNSDNTIEQISPLALDCSNVRTPDSGDRFFHGPRQGRRPPLSHGLSNMGRPPVPQPQRNNVVVQQMPGAIFDMDAPLPNPTIDSPVPSRPASGGSAAARASSVPVRQVERHKSPLQLSSPSKGAAVALSGVSAFGNSPSPSLPSPKLAQKPLAEVTEILAFGAEPSSLSGPDGNIGYAACGGGMPRRARARRASPSPVLGCTAGLQTGSLDRDF